MLVAVACIVVTRLATIALTPGSVHLDDIRGYQITGRLVAEGINPYDYADHAARRQALRIGMKADPVKVHATDSQALWDYYVSSNLPMVALLCGAMEMLAHGSRFIWRLLMIGGDIAIFFGLAALFRRVQGGLESTANQVGILALSVFYPALIVDGTAIPEVKQVETALMLFGAALLLAPRPLAAWRGVVTGAVLSLSILFMLFGAFLFPVWLRRSVQEWPRFVLWTVLGGLIPVAVSFWAFGTGFVPEILARASTEGGGTAMHSSIWMLLPWQSAAAIMAAKIVSATVAFAVLVLLLARRRIDLMNFSAGLAVIYGTLWLSHGALNRENITLVFAIACLATLSPAKFLLNALYAMAVSGVVFLGFGVLKLALHVGLTYETASASIVLLVVCGYFATLATMPATAAEFPQPA